MNTPAETPKVKKSGRLECKRCGVKFNPPLPCTRTEFRLQFIAFMERHEGCPSRA